MSPNGQSEWLPRTEISKKQNCGRRGGNGSYAWLLPVIDFVTFLCSHAYKTAQTIMRFNGLLRAAGKNVCRKPNQNVWDSSLTTFCTLIDQLALIVVKIQL